MQKLKSLPYDSVIYLIILFVAYVVGGYLLAIYNVNLIILIGTYLVVLRLAQTGSSSIGIAIAWLSTWFWGSAFLWARPISLGDISAQKVALLLLLCWLFSMSSIFLLAFAHKRVAKLGGSQTQTVYGLTGLTWGSMTIGWYAYQWTLGI
ncbi:hypothetical protein [Pseudanabaena mucicola]|uniref:Uncharacterized protein n=1 Tax=Pseudanabaena mucicola FACHB-723 TaxID=2692860 RepID=A0ABR7ZTA6_9CYAN|nr:hypothetical protein [Pseudanabaena mucicola]MBD2187208.1 hypothetical protein [Pseudanabaena mucicola FACHB-723]